MKEFRVKFIERITRSQSVVSFRFSFLAPIDFIPGQFAQIIFDEEEKANRQLNKYLSFSCRPGKEYIELTKRISESDFSKRLMALKKGDEILLKGPMGHCTLQTPQGVYAFLIGGIGITPVMSILEQIAFKKVPADIYLLYSNMTNADIPFEAELESWAKQIEGFHLVHTAVECVRQDKPCFTGMITKELVVNQIPDYPKRIFYIFGPPAMVSAMSRICKELGCLAENVKAENFVGY